MINLFKQWWCGFKTLHTPSSPILDDGTYFCYLCGKKMKHFTGNKIGLR